MKLILEWYSVNLFEYIGKFLLVPSFPVDALDCSSLLAPAQWFRRGAHLVRRLCRRLLSRPVRVDVAAVVAVAVAWLFSDLEDADDEQR